MRRRKERCLSCNEKPARDRDYFCTDRCGASWAYSYCSASYIPYCDYCGHAYFEVEPPVICVTCGNRTREEEDG